jgi:transposase InsO family protein
MRELSVAEQRYQAVMAVIGDGLPISRVAEKVGVSRQTLHSWLARYEADGLDGLMDRSHRPASCPHQMPAQVEAVLLELRRSRPYWGPRRLVFELMKRQVSPVPSSSAVYRALLRAGMIDPAVRDRRSRKFKRWERGAPMELWQMDVVGGFPLDDGSSAKALTGIDDHSRMCVCARLMARERTRAVCDGLRGALAAYGVPEQILTDNGKVFTGRFNHPPAEAICRENGIEHLLTQPRSPTTTGKIERFHRSLRTEFLSNQAPFTNLKTAQQALDEWVNDYNTNRPHQSLKMATPAQRFRAGAPAGPPPNRSVSGTDRNGDDWISRRDHQRGGVRVLAASQHRPLLRRRSLRCPRRRRAAAVLGRRSTGQNRRAPHHRRGTNQTGHAHQRKHLKHNKSVKDQPKQIRQPSTDSEQRHR